MSKYKSDDTFVNWRWMSRSTMVSLASLAGERMFFDGDSSAGVNGDLHNATYFATVMESRLGMGDAGAAHAVIQEFDGGAEAAPRRQLTRRTPTPGTAPTWPTGSRCVSTKSSMK